MTTDLKFSLILPFVGPHSDRFQKWDGPTDLAGQIARAAQVEGAGALEVIYPYNLQDVPTTKRLMDDHGLACSSVNVNIKADPQFHMGSLTSPDPKIRAAAVQWIKEAMDVAPQMGCDIVTCCPLGDGHEYSFQVDYQQAWGHFIEGLREAASHRSDVRLSLEYKLNETRGHVIMGSAMSALYVAEQTGLPNVGVTVDIGHALYALETPALSITQCAAANRLFLVHVNDNYRNWDWDLVPGSVNWWDWVENLLYIDQVGYEGWLVSDVMPARLDAVEVLTAVGRSITRGQKLLSMVDKDTLWAAIRRNDALAAYDLFYAALGLD